MSNTLSERIHECDEHAVHCTLQADAQTSMTSKNAN
jgi:hypothetical protein